MYPKNYCTKILPCYITTRRQKYPLLRKKEARLPYAYLILINHNKIWATNIKSFALSIKPQKENNTSTCIVTQNLYITVLLVLFSCANHMDPNSGLGISSSFTTVKASPLITVKDYIIGFLYFVFCNCSVLFLSTFIHCFHLRVDGKFSF